MSSSSARKHASIRTQPPAPAGDGMYPCSFCDARLASPKDRIEHVLESHLDEARPLEGHEDVAALVDPNGPGLLPGVEPANPPDGSPLVLWCSICDRRFDTFEGLNAHKVGHQTTAPVTQGALSSTSPGPAAELGDEEDHAMTETNAGVMPTMNELDPELLCSECDRVLPSKRSLGQHLSKGHGVRGSRATTPRPEKGRRSANRLETRKGKPKPKTGEELARLLGVPANEIRRAQGQKPVNGFVEIWIPTGLVPAVREALIAAAVDLRAELDAVVQTVDKLEELRTTP